MRRTLSRPAKSGFLARIILSRKQYTIDTAKREEYLAAMERYNHVCNR